MKKLLCLSGFVVAVGASHASFELALVAQFHASAPGQSFVKIGRWDPQNGVNLGYFGEGLVRGNVLSIDPTQSSTVADIYGSGNAISVQRFNYSTGEDLGMSSLSLSGNNVLNDGQILNNGQLLAVGIVNGTVSARLINANGTIAGNYNLPAGTIETMCIHQNSAGVTFVLSRQSAGVGLSRYTLTSYNANSFTIASTSVIESSTSSVYKNMIYNEGRIVVGGGGAFDRYVVPVSSSTLGAVNSSSGFLTSANTWFAGHGNTYYSFGLNSTSSRLELTKMNGTSPGSFRYFTGTEYGAILDSAIVVAPEPVTMVGLGLGLAALLRRRKNRSTL